MKIIKPGIPQPDPLLSLWVGTCENCGCEVEFNGNEVENPNYLTNTAHCPTMFCKHFITLRPK